MDILRKRNKISKTKLNPTSIDGRKNYSTFISSKTLSCCVVREPYEIATLTITLHCVVAWGAI